MPQINRFDLLTQVKSRTRLKMDSRCFGGQKWTDTSFNWFPVQLKVTSHEVVETQFSVWPPGGGSVCSGVQMFAVPPADPGIIPVPHDSGTTNREVTFCAIAVNYCGKKFHRRWRLPVFSHLSAGHPSLCTPSVSLQARPFDL